MKHRNNFESTNFIDLRFCGNKHICAIYILVADIYITIVTIIVLIVTTVKEVYIYYTGILSILIYCSLIFCARVDIQYIYGIPYCICMYYILYRKQNKGKEEN